MQYKGYFRIHRKLFLSPIWLNSKPEHKAILITILGRVNWTDGTAEWCGHDVLLKAGQAIVSYKKIADLCGKGITPRQVRNAFKRFNNLGFLIWETSPIRTDGIKVTISNWDSYQHNED